MESQNLCIIILTPLQNPQKFGIFMFFDLLLIIFFLFNKNC